MTVTQQQVATLRAQLAGDVEEHRRLLTCLDESDAAGYATLLTAAFCEAVERRFGTDPDPAAVIEFVGEMRARSELIRDQLSAEFAERMILSVSAPADRSDGPGDPAGPDDLSDLDDETVIGVQLMITGSLIGDETLNGDGLDAFVATVRSTAVRFTR